MGTKVVVGCHRKKKMVSVELRCAPSPLSSQKVEVGPPQ